MCVCVWGGIAGIVFFTMNPKFEISNKFFFFFGGRGEGGEGGGGGEGG